MEPIEMDQNTVDAFLEMSKDIERAQEVMAAVTKLMDEQEVSPHVGHTVAILMIITVGRKSGISFDLLLRGTIEGMRMVHHMVSKEPTDTVNL